MTPIDTQRYLDDLAQRLLKVRRVYQEVDAGSSGILWLHDRAQNIDWMLAPSETMDPERFSSFIEDSTLQAAEHRHKVREALTDRPGLVCPVLVTHRPSEATVAFVRGYVPKLKMALTWGRWVYPVIVDLDAGAVICPERRPRLLSVGGLVGRSFSKRARRVAQQSFLPTAA